MSESQMENVKRELDNRRHRMSRVCETIEVKESRLDTVLTNMIIDT